MQKKLFWSLVGFSLLIAILLCVLLTGGMYLFFNQQLRTQLVEDADTLTSLLDTETDHVLVVGLITVLASALFYLLLTPAFLRDPLGFPVYLVKNAVGFSRWHGTVLFDGRRIFTASEKLPWQYLPVMILITTPIWMLVLLFLGQGAALVRGLRQGKAWLQREEGFLLTLASLLWLLPLMAAIASRMRLYQIPPVVRPAGPVLHTDTSKRYAFSNRRYSSSPHVNVCHPGA